MTEKISHTKKSRRTLDGQLVWIQGVHLTESLFYELEDDSVGEVLLLIEFFATNL